MYSILEYLLRVILFIGQHGGDVEHDLDVSPLRVDAARPRQVVDGVETP